VRGATDPRAGFNNSVSVVVAESAHFQAGTPQLRKSATARDVGPTSPPLAETRGCMTVPLDSRLTSVRFGLVTNWGGHSMSDIFSSLNGVVGDSCLLESLCCVIVADRKITKQEIEAVAALCSEWGCKFQGAALHENIIKNCKLIHSKGIAAYADTIAEAASSVSASVADLFLRNVDSLVTCDNVGAAEKQAVADLLRSAFLLAKEDALVIDADVADVVNQSRGLAASGGPTREEPFPELDQLRVSLLEQCSAFASEQRLGKRLAVGESMPAGIQKVFHARYKRIIATYADFKVRVNIFERGLSGASTLPLPQLWDITWQEFARSAITTERFAGSRFLKVHRQDGGGEIMILIPSGEAPSQWLPELIHALHGTACSFGGEGYRCDDSAGTTLATRVAGSSNSVARQATEDVVAETDSWGIAKRIGKAFLALPGKAKRVSQDFTGKACESCKINAAHATKTERSPLEEYVGTAWRNVSTGRMVVDLPAFPKMGDWVSVPATLRRYTKYVYFECEACQHKWIESTKNEMLKDMLAR
jgi:hypothetical protein